MWCGGVDDTLSLPLNTAIGCTVRWILNIIILPKTNSFLGHTHNDSHLQDISSRTLAEEDEERRS